MDKITLPLANETSLSGVLDKNLKKLGSRLGVSLALRGDQLLIDGDTQRSAFARHYFEKLNELRDRGHQLREEDLLIALDMLEESPSASLDDYAPAEPLNLSRKSVNPKSLNQQAYLQAIKTHDLVFGIGPAGTGKTYLAMAMALAFLQNKAVNRIILTRPGGRGRGKARFPAGRPHPEGQSLPPPALRRPVRPVPVRPGQPPDRARASSRSRPWPSCAAGR